MAFMVTSPRSKTPALLMPRRCKYCKGNFIPERPQDKDAKFCTPNHRKAFWRYGGLPFDKMKEQIMKDVRKLVRESLHEEFNEFKRLQSQLIANAIQGWIHDAEQRAIQLSKPAAHRPNR